MSTTYEQIEQEAFRGELAQMLGVVRVHSGLHVAEPLLGLGLVGIHGFAKPLEPSVTDKTILVFPYQMLKEKGLLCFADKALYLPYAVLI